ncbi:uncharacterized protein (TIGR02271 family) [Arthrobacter sp. ES3-54]|nr:uncharacterized protein (TIGR02271 family) [Arthrobacter sp. ES3-54]
MDNKDGQPSWVTVRTGLFGMSESFVPLEGARTEGNDIVVPYSKDHVKDAPRIDADRPLEPAEEDRLYQHYQLDTGRTYTEATTADSGPGPERTGAPAATGTTAPTEQRDTTDDATTPAAQRDTAAPDRTQAPAAAAAGYDTTTATEQRETTAPDRTAATSTPGAPGYDTTTATEQRETTAPDRTAAPTVAATPAATGAYDTTEQRNTAAPERTQAPTAAGTGTAGYDTAAPTEHGDTAQRDTGAAATATGRARLRKYVTTEQVTKTVPVQREEVRIEREPITEENRDEASNRADQDDERDVILHEERLIVTKETVPVERVHIGTETVTEEVTINEEVRKEHIDTDGPEEGRG